MPFWPWVTLKWPFLSPTVFLPNHSRRLPSLSLFNQVWHSLCHSYLILATIFSVLCVFCNSSDFFPPSLAQAGWKSFDICISAFASPSCQAGHVLPYQLVWPFFTVSMHYELKSFYRFVCVEHRLFPVLACFCVLILCQTYTGTTVAVGLFTMRLVGRSVCLLSIGFSRSLCQVIAVGFGSVFLFSITFLVTGCRFGVVILSIYISICLYFSRLFLSLIFCFGRERRDAKSFFCFLFIPMQFDHFFFHLLPLFGHTGAKTPTLATILS